MARKKASLDPIQKKCELEAINFIVDWYQRQHLYIDVDDIFISWFAFTKGGYRCMASSYTNQNLFFEISVNRKTKDVQCDCYERYAHISVNGTNYKTVNLTDRKWHY